MSKLLCNVLKISWGENAPNVPLLVARLFLCYVKYQWPQIATDFFTSLTVCQF